MRIAGYCILVALRLAQMAVSPVYSVRTFVSFGRSLTLPCDGDPSRDVDWLFKQDELPRWLFVAQLHTGAFSSGNGFQGRVESFHLTEPGNYSLTLSPVVYSDLGIYKCQYKDETEILLSDVKLEIRVPSNVSIAMGMSASLPCFGKINMQAHAGDLDILWKRGGEKVYQIHKNTITYGPRFENRASVSPEQALYGNMSLTIGQTRFSDEGDYQCFYNSPKEMGNPDSASLVVTGHPPQTLTVKAGGLLSIPLYTADPVRVTFSALGSDEVMMLDANKGPARYGKRCAQRCELLAQNYTLLLRSVTLEDAGVYKVTDPETKKTISSVSLHVSASAGLSAGAVAGIVVGAMVLLLVLAGSAFAVWKFFMKTGNFRNVVHFRTARTEDH
ncbi:carcinoembryonic antigen-related cell adhesion molecule 1-like [Anguilla rostrata]|uniref:carcinoembryonic antigen-related cell adhesion molecule 1-like n=1 Tax=Anguilla rostrata TaxID=7938 RepID=UPI0030CD9C8D